MKKKPISSKSGKKKTVLLQSEDSDTYEDDSSSEEVEPQIFPNKSKNNKISNELNKKLNDLSECPRERIPKTELDYHRHFQFKDTFISIKRSNKPSSLSKVIDNSILRLNEYDAFFGEEISKKNLGEDFYEEEQILLRARQSLFED